jgi:glycine/D-amino acid oxidase-like deaminating enzyme
MDPFLTESHSVWQTIDKPFSPPLSFDLTTDVCIVGAGIAGLTTAYLLLKEGHDVVVIDRERLGMNQSGLTTAHLSNALDDGYAELQRLHGEEGARLAAESHTRAIDEIERIVKEEEIDCDFTRTDGYLFLGPEEDVDDLREEMNAAREAGLADVELLSNAPVPLFNTGSCLHFPRQAQFHPVKYMLGLAHAIQKRGGKIFSHTAAVQIEGGYPGHVTTSQGFQINCDAIVMATNVPVNNRVTIHTKIAAYRSYVIGLRIPKGSMDKALLWDTEDPYHYLRVTPDPDSPDDILLIGGEDHRTGQEVHPEERFYRLLQWAQNRLAVEPEPVYHWSGQIIEPIDGMAYIGRNPGDADNVFIVTGDSGHGMTHGTIAGMLLRDLILERENPWAELYDPARLNWKGLDTYLKEAVQSTAPYSEWILPGDVDSADQVRPGEGAILRDGLRKLAVYRDDAGHLHTF